MNLKVDRTGSGRRHVPAGAAWGPKCRAGRRSAGHRTAVSNTAALALAQTAASVAAETSQLFGPGRREPSGGRQLRRATGRGCLNALAPIAPQAPLGPRAST